MDEHEEEQWLPVAGYEGLYEVSDLGSVKSLDRAVRTGNDKLRWVAGRTLQPQPTHRGYLKVNLCKHGTKTNCKIHHIVAEAFFGPHPSNHVVEHIDQDRHNNRKKNLEYMLRKESDRQGGSRTRGTSHGNCKLTEADVRLIRQDERSEREISQEFNISHSRVGSIRRREAWGWLPDEEQQDEGQCQ